MLRVLFELGNDTINQIYESYIPNDCELEHATEHCDRPVREAWIRAKYIDKRFVTPLMFGESTTALATAAAASANVNNNNRLDANARNSGPGKWSVLKTRRRSCQRRSKPRVEVDEDKDLDSTSSQRSDILIIGENFKVSSGVTDNEMDVSPTVVTTGHSDQESTSGEEDIIGKFLFG